SLARSLEHSVDVFAGRPVTLASRRGHPAVVLLQRRRWSVEQVKVQKDATRLQVRADVTVDLADALEIAQVVKATGRHSGVKGAELRRQPVLVEEIGLIGGKARAIIGHDLPPALQHRLGTVLSDAGGVGVLIEDKFAHW